MDPRGTCAECGREGLKLIWSSVHETLVTPRHKTILIHRDAESGEQIGPTVKVFCPGGGKRPAKSASTARCPRCGQQVRLRAQGRFKGHLWKHRTLQGTQYPGTELIPGGWCDYHGDPHNLPDYLNPYSEQGAGPAAIVCGPGGIDETVDGFDNTGPGASSYIPSSEPPPEGIKAAYRLEARKVALADWWEERAASEIGMVVSKAIEYGATDLRDIGRQLAEMADRPLDNDDYGNAVATELGIIFYVLGKVSRLVAAAKEGRQPSLDTWLDIGIYARMAQRVHETGGWPGV